MRPGNSNGSNNTTSSKKRGSPASGMDQKRSQSRRKKSETEVLQIPLPLPLAPSVHIKVEETTNAQIPQALPVQVSGESSRQDHSTASNDEPEQDHVDYLHLAFGSFIGSGEGKEENIANDDDCTIEVPCGLLLAMQSNEKKVVDDALGLGFDNGWNSSNGGGFLDDDGLAWNRSSDFGLGL